MLKYILIALMLVGCSDGPPCPQIVNEDYKTGIFSRNLGPVNINGEQCQIFEQYSKTNCSIKKLDVQRVRPLNCSGPSVECQERILTRVTKCPNSSASNSITYSQDKFHVERVQ